MFRRGICAVGLLIVCWGVPSVEAQVPPPPPPSPTLWSFLGIPQACYKLNAQLFNRRGNMPGLEKKPPLKAIADVANLKSDVPAIKAAAEIKQAEDLKPQKVKAIKYLATIGCGCYDKDGKVTKALLAAMEDCTEDVRLEAVRAIAVAASGEQCEHCKQRSCCSEDVVKQLSKIAYERDDNGCFVEPSERVREAAIEAMGICCMDRGPPIQIETTPPRPVEGADQPPPPVEGVNPANPDDAPPKPPIDDPDKVTFQRAIPRFEQPTQAPAPITRLTSSRRNFAAQQVNSEFVSPDMTESTGPATPAAVPAPAHQPAIAPVFTKVTGTVTRINHSMGMVQLQLNQGLTLPIGYTVKVYHHLPGGPQLSAVLKILESHPGMASAQLVGSSRTHQFSTGEIIEVFSK
jgi:hypothetical protein